MKLTDDPISIALVVASVGLLALYAHENSKLSALDEAEGRAQSIDLGPLQDDSCEAHAAGFDGGTLTIRCENRSGAEAIAKSVADAGVHAGFSSVMTWAAGERTSCELPLDETGSCKSVDFQ